MVRTQVDFLPLILALARCGWSFVLLSDATNLKSSHGRVIGVVTVTRPFLGMQVKQDLYKGYLRPERSGHRYERGAPGLTTRPLRSGHRYERSGQGIASRISRLRLPNNPQFHATKEIDRNSWGFRPFRQRLERTRNARERGKEEVKSFTSLM